MLSITDLSFRHGERVLFDRASVAFSEGWKVGLVGRNGAGKSTLLKIIQGQYEADSGEINLMPGAASRTGNMPASLSRACVRGCTGNTSGSRLPTFASVEQMSDSVPGSSTLLGRWSVITP